MNCKSNFHKTNYLIFQRNRKQKTKVTSYTIRPQIHIKIKWYQHADLKEFQMNGMQRLIFVTWKQEEKTLISNACTMDAIKCSQNLATWNIISEHTWMKNHSNVWSATHLSHLKEISDDTFSLNTILIKQLSQTFYLCQHLTMVVILVVQLLNKYLIHYWEWEIVFQKWLKKHNDHKTKKLLKLIQPTLSLNECMKSNKLEYFNQLFLIFKPIYIQI